MLRLNFKNHDLSCNRTKKTSLGVNRPDDIKLNTSFDEHAYSGNVSGKFVYRAAQIAKHFIPALMIALMLLIAPPPTQARISIGVTVGIAPPPLLVYEQPPCPGPNFIWTPGYWAWGPDGYFWVPGTWVLAPYPGELWTPGYWAWDLDDDAFLWHEGYWGPEIGFYGGINYGFGYFGDGYEGGYWRNSRFYYNREVNNISSTNITTVYNRAVVNSTTNYVSYNGGRGGVTAQPTATQLAAARQRHAPPTPLQRTQLQAARWNRAQLASANGGRPAVAATPRPGVFSGPQVVRASRFGGRVNAANNRATENQLPGRPARQDNHIGRPMMNGHPGAADTTRPSGRSAEPNFRTPRVRPQSDRGHASPQRGQANQQRLPQQEVRPKPIPHVHGNANAAEMRGGRPGPQRETRPVAQQRSTPSRRAAPRGGPPFRSAAQPRSAQHPNPRPPHGGR